MIVSARPRLLQRLPESGSGHRGSVSGPFVRRPQVTSPAPLARGSFLSRIGKVEVRIIECEITIATTAGRHADVYRLATTLLDQGRYPAFELVKLYHER